MPAAEAARIPDERRHPTRQPLDYNRQCLEEGAANLAGGFFQCLPGSGSLSRSAINHQAGALTRFFGVVVALAVAAAVLAFAPLTQFIPKAALAGLLFVTAARLIDLKRLGYAIRASLDVIEQFLREAETAAVTVRLAGAQPDLLALVVRLRLTDGFPAERSFPEEDDRDSATIKAVRQTYAEPEAGRRETAGGGRLYYLV